MEKDFKQRRERLKLEANKLPVLPGVYLMKDREGSIIYVGKSKHLRLRVSSYFGASKNKPRKTLRMVRQIETFDYMLTDTELDALLLECDLIKKIQPIYNRLLKNDSRYRYLHLNESSEMAFWESAYDRKERGIYFGPYDMKYELQEAAQVINQYYGLAQCKGRGNWECCFALVKEECLAPCKDDYSKDEYAKRIQASMAFLKNEEEDILRDYETKMQEAAENLQFEVAGRYKQSLMLLNRITYREKAIKWCMSSEKLIAYIPMPTEGIKVYFFIGANIIKTTIIKKKRFLNKWKSDFDIELAEKKHMEKGEMDRAYIIYSYLRRNESCECIRIE